MPKVVSRGSIVSSTTAQPTASSAANLRVYYCICGEFILVIDKSLASLPRRNTDGAIIVQAQDTSAAKAKVFKLNATPIDPVLYERPDGYERQFRFQCPRCNLPVAYQVTPPPVKSGTFVYIIKGALSQVQGQVPPEAFESEQ